MGVDYRSTVGWGFAIPEEDLERLAEKVEYEESEWGFDPWEFGYWLAEGRSVQSEYVGNIMGGEDIHILLAAESTLISADPFYDSGLKKLGDIKPTQKELDDLEELYDKLYGTEPDLGWVLAMTIS